ncbi:MAG: WG repeat-containing protein [Cytophagales bacterium]|nr:MAG: WG repeat-containing protein [Cytophagales bacterium]
MKNIKYSFIAFLLCFLISNLFAQKPKKGGFQRTVISISDLKKADIPKADSLQEEDSSPSSIRSNKKPAGNITDFNTVYSNDAAKQGKNYPKGRTKTVDSVYVEKAKYSISIIQQGKLFGAVSDASKVILPLMYDNVTFYNQKDSACSRWEGVLLIQKDGLYALCNADGSPMTPMIYEEIPYLPETCGGSQPIFKVKQGGKFGLMDNKGGILIRSAYDDVFMLKTDKGKLTTPEVACVRKQNKYGFLELREKQILPTQYDKIAFLQHIEIKEKDKIKTNLLIKVWQNGKCGVMNLSDKTEIPIEYTDIQPFEHSLALVRKNGKFGFIDLEGKEKVSIKYDYAQGFKQGIAILKKGESFGAINTERKEVIDFAYQSLEYLIDSPKEGNDEQEFMSDFLRAKKGDKYGIINLQGRAIIPFNYTSLIVEGFGFKAKKDNDSPEEFISMPTASSNK